MSERFGTNDPIYDMTRLLSLPAAQSSTDDAITDLSGDVSATGPGAVTATLATVNANVGTFGSATQVAQVTVNGKGLVTAAANVTISGVTPAAHDIAGALHTTSGRTAGQVLQATGATTFGWSTNTLSIAGNSTINGSLIGNISGGGTIATGGFTGTIPESMTFAGRNVANTFTAIQKINVNSTAALVVEQDGIKDDTLRVDTTNGRVGIGVTGTIQRHLHISGVGNIFTLVQSTDSGIVGHLFVGGARQWNFQVRNDGRFYIEDNTAGDKIRFKINDSGGVGLGGSIINSTAAMTGAAVAIGNTGGLSVIGLADVQQMTVTGFATQTATTTLLQATRNDANTNALGTIATWTHNTTGTAAAGFGARHLWQLESSTTASQDAAALDVSWTDATHATRTSRLDVSTTGPGKCAAWGYNGVDGTARTIIANGAGDVTEGITVQYVASEVTGTDSYGGIVYLEPSDSFAINTDGTNALTLACAADGSVTIQRTAGTDTYKVMLWMVWQ